MDPKFWIERWAQGQIGFHQDAVHADLLRWGERFLAGGPYRVLVPLCGKSKDIKYLVGRGQVVVGADLSEIAVRDLHKEAEIEAEVAREGELTVWRSSGLTVYVGDIFALSPELVGSFDRIWDRAALVALDPPRRTAYAHLMRSLLKPGGVMLLNSFRFTGEKSGPPHSVPEHEIFSHYGAHGRLELLDAADRIHEEPRWREAGLSEWIESTWWFEQKR